MNTARSEHNVDMASTYLPVMGALRCDTKRLARNLQARKRVCCFVMGSKKRPASF